MSACERFFGLCVVVVITTTACQESDQTETVGDSGNSSTSSGSLAISENPEATAAAAALKEGSAATLLSTSASAIQSAQIGSLAIQASLALDEKGTQSVNDSLCSRYAEPFDTSTNALMSDRADGYGPRSFYCKINSNVIESSESVAGFLAQTQSIICSVEETFAVAVEDFTDEGKQLITETANTISLSDECWPQGTPDGLTEVGLDSVVLKKLEQSTGFQFELSLASSNMGIEYQLRFFNADGIFGFKVAEPGRGNGSGTNIGLVLDTTKGVLYFNEINDRNSEDDSYRGLSLIRAKGKMNKNLNFDEIEEGRGYIYISGPGFDGDKDVQEADYSVYTVDGTSEDGFKFKTYSTNGSKGVSLEVVNEVCSSGSCSAVSDFATIEEMVTYFASSTAIREQWLEYINSGKLPCEPESGSNVVVQIAAVPSPTGDLGRCSL